MKVIVWFIHERKKNLIINSNQVLSVRRTREKDEIGAGKIGSWTQ